MSSEVKRQYTHILLFLFAFTLKYMSTWQAVLLIAGLLLFTTFVLPRLSVKKHFYRPAEKKFSRGAISYFLTLFVLVLLFPLYIVAASWAILALGDGMATLVGRHFKASNLPWNKNKSYAGSLAFVISAALGCYILLWWSGVQSTGLLSVSLKVAIVAALAETLPWRLDDNISVALASAVSLFILL